jgi:hypothetical protein
MSWFLCCIYMYNMDFSGFFCCVVLQGFVRVCRLSCHSVCVVLQGFVRVRRLCHTFRVVLQGFVRVRQRPACWLPLVVLYYRDLSEFVSAWPVGYHLLCCITGICQSSSVVSQFLCCFTGIFQSSSVVLQCLCCFTGICQSSSVVSQFLAHLDEVEMSLCYTPGVRVPVRVRFRLKFLG